MSLKPIKKGDLGKSWLNRRSTKTIKIQPEYHLIATEGTRTEPAYFKAIQSIINAKYREKINLETIGIGNNTLNLLNEVKNMLKLIKMYINMFGLFMMLMIFLRKV